MNIVVSGVGVVSALGIGVESNINKIKTGLSGISPQPTILATKHNLPVGEIGYTNTELAHILGFKSSRNYSRTSLLGMIAVKEAINDAGINTCGNVGLVSSTTVGGMDLTEKNFESIINGINERNLFTLKYHECYMVTRAITDFFKIDGYTTTLSTACSSAANAIIIGARLLRHNIVDSVIVGGTDALSQFTFNGFNSLKILDSSICKPFDANRNGLNLGEGAGYIILQREQDAKKIYCKISGYANCNDAYHQTASSIEGNGAYLAMKGALRKANLKPCDVNYINAHGTGTLNNDLSESNAMKRIFAKKMPMFSSTKGFTGHTLAAAGGIEAVYSALAVKFGYIFPSLNFSEIDTTIGIKPYLEFTTGVNINNVMSNSFGFGGNCTSIIFSKVG